MQCPCPAEEFFEVHAGSDGRARHWAVMATFIETCKLGGVNPFAYLRDILTRIITGHTINRIAELLPWASKAQPADPPPDKHPHINTPNPQPAIIPAA